MSDAKRNITPIGSPDATAQYPKNRETQPQDAKHRRLRFAQPQMLV